MCGAQLSPVCDESGTHFPWWLPMLHQEISGVRCSVESQKERAGGNAAGGTVAPPEWLWWLCSCPGEGNAPVLGAWHPESQA